MPDDPFINALMQVYGYGHEPAGPAGDPNSLGYALAGPAAPLSTADILKRYSPPNALSQAADYIPANPDHGVSLANMAKASLKTAGHWGLDWQPEVGPDTLAPLGLAGVGALAARPAVAMTRPREWPTTAAIRWGDEVVTGPNHAHILMNRPGYETHALNPEDGFVTNSGRFVSREEAAAMVDGHRQGRPFVSEAIEGAGDAQFRRAPGFASTLTVENSRASLPGTLLSHTSSPQEGDDQRLFLVNLLSRYGIE